MMVKVRSRKRTKKQPCAQCQWVAFVALLIVMGISFTRPANTDGQVDIGSNLSPSSTTKKSLRKGLATAMTAQSILQSQKPYLLYGTAWKKEETRRLVSEAIRSGFRFVDTACQPKHYNEAGVGDGWVQATKELGLSRSDIFLQTKFTPIDGQDPNRVPYNVKDELEEQVKQSIQVSLENLKTTYIDSLVLHSPLRSNEDTMRVWRVLESFVDEGVIHQLGISNCYDINRFKYFYEKARVKPKVLQNRFYADSNFDVELREFCRDSGVLYQSFWTLTGNRRALSSPEIKEMAEEKKLTSQTLMYAFMMALGHTPLSGTTNKGHMMEDVAVMERVQNGEEILSQDELESMARILGI